jgi:hypothetical protein
MARFLHLLKGDSAALARPVIEQNSREAGATVTVVLLDGAAAGRLPEGVTVHRLGSGDLNYSALLDLIFEADHVITW